MNAADHLYVHVPFCDGKCAYCGFYSVPHESVQRSGIGIVTRYLDAVAREMDRQLPADGAPCTVYFGGGTPSILSAAHLARLCRLVHERCDLGRLEEWTVEANPATLSPEKLEVLTEAGVNRISMGVQSLSDATLRAIGRRHAAGDVGRTLDLVRDAGIGSTALDLIAGLPGVCGPEWEQTVRGVAELAPGHVSVYALSIEKGSRFAELREAGGLNIPDERAQLLAMARAEQILSHGGYRRYEVSNFAQPGHECRHNLSCWRGEDYLGFGPAASSRRRRKRWTNIPDLDTYIAESGGEWPARERETVDPGTDAAERLAFAFRLAEGVELDAFCRQYDVSDELTAHWETSLASLTGAGLVVRRGRRWAPTSKGFRFADTIAAELLPAPRSG